jgi:hypothetical protein
VSLPERHDEVPAALDRIAVTRAELLDGYEHPYRRRLPIALKHHHVHRWLAADAGLIALWAVGALTGSAALTIVGGLFTVLALLLTAAIATRALSDGIEAIRARTAEWRPGQGELAKVRRGRPHAGESDTGVAHDEYAVAVSDDGRLVTYLYTPLMAGERPGPAAVLIPGKPRYEAVEVRADRFDPNDAAHAAEQLAAAQEHAADLESAAIERARAELVEREAALDLAVETKTTAAALRRITGQ